MNKEQAVNYLKFSGFSEEQIKAIEGAFTCEDAISRQAAVDFLKKHAETYKDVTVKMTFMTSASLINNRNNLPPVTPQPKTGHWIFDEVLDRHYYCSECKSMGVDYWDYCPNCGAKMAEPQESEDKE